VANQAQEINSIAWGDPKRQSEIGQANNGRYSEVSQAESIEIRSDGLH
jgi:hypothetical protein